MLEEQLKKYFGHDCFRPLQREVIESVMAGDSSLAVFPTGAGKSLTYQLPALLLPGTSIVVSPLISLIKDQVESLKRSPLPNDQARSKHASKIGFLDSTLSATQRQSTLDSLSAGDYQIFFTSPESLANPELMQRLGQIDIALAVIDEAHCITSWGHSFRPAYLYLPKLLRKLKPHATLALTATATRKTSSEIRKLFKIKKQHHFESDIARPNLSFKVLPCTATERPQALIKSLQGSNSLPAVVYVTRQEDSEEIAHFLSQNGYETRAFHAGMSPKARAIVQQAFMGDQLEVIVATIAFGMGVDKANIRSVIHYHLPKSPEGWMQESGRAGRDGQASCCTVLACGDDLITLGNFIHASEISESSLQQFLQQLFAQGTNCTLSPHQARVQFDIAPSTFAVIMAKLEVAGTLGFQSTSWRYVRAWPIAGQKLQIQDQPKKLQAALTSIFEAGDRVDTHALSENLGFRNAALWSLLHELDAAREIKLITSGWHWHYKIKKNPEQFIPSFCLQQSEHTQLELAKLEEVTRIATSRSCIPRQLAKFFGHNNQANCGHCSSCLKEKRPRTLPQSTLIEPSEEELELIHDLLEQKAHRIHSASQLTRFLCGIHSSRNRHYYLHQHPSFGLLRRLPYQDVNHYAIAIMG